MKLRIKETSLNEAVVNDKTYIFRGESNNNYQSNYSKKNRLPFESRFFAYDIFSEIVLFGDVVVYELLDDSKLWYYDDSVEEFIKDYDLENYEFPELYKVYKIHSLSELTEYGGDIKFDYHDLYHARQLCTISFLEQNYKNKYDGIVWYESWDEPETQLMIWNMNIVRKLRYAEAKQVMSDLKDLFENEYDDTDSMYSLDAWGEPKYVLHR